MHTRTEMDKSCEIFVATINKGDSRHYRGAVSHPIGSDTVSIRATSPSWDGILIKGKKNLRLLRDALIKICEMESIE